MDGEDDYIVTVSKGQYGVATVTTTYSSTDEPEEEEATP